MHAGPNYTPKDCSTAVSNIVIFTGRAIPEIDPLLSSHILGTLTLLAGELPGMTYHSATRMMPESVDIPVKKFVLTHIL